MDVIDCYERRKYRTFGSTNQRLHQSSAPTRKISTVTEDLSNEKVWGQEQKHNDGRQSYLEKQSTNSMMQRAFAIENEIRSFRNMKNSNK